MKLHCLGTAGYHPSETRHTASFFIPEHNLLLDAGTGVFRLQPLIMSREVSILLSHAHLDHVVGLTFLWDVLSGTPLERIHVYAEEEKIEQLKDFLAEGKAESFEEYKKLCGEVRGLLIMRGYTLDLKQRLENSDD